MLQLISYMQQGAPRRSPCAQVEVRPAAVVPVRIRKQPGYMDITVTAVPVGPVWGITQDSHDAPPSSGELVNAPQW